LIKDVIVINNVMEKCNYESRNEPTIHLSTSWYKDINACLSIPKFNFQRLNYEHFIMTQFAIWSNEKTKPVKHQRLKHSYSNMKSKILDSFNVSGDVIYYKENIPTKTQRNCMVPCFFGVALFLCDSSLFILTSSINQTTTNSFPLAISLSHKSLWNKIIS